MDASLPYDESAFEAAYRAADTGVITSLAPHKLSKANAKREAARQKTDFVHDLEELRDEFNVATIRAGLGVRMNTDKLAHLVLTDVISPQVEYFDGKDLGGRIYPNQIRTAVKVFKELIRHPRHFVQIIGALQSGKTGTGNALQFFGPVYYLLTQGMVKVYPLYLVTNYQSHLAQTKFEFRRFLKYYGGIEFEYDSASTSLLDYYGRATQNEILSVEPVLPVQTDDNEIDIHFETSPTLKNYRTHVLNTDDELLSSDVEKLVYRRVRGVEIKRLVQHVEDLCDRGFTPLPIFDETQYGASAKEEADDPKVARGEAGAVLKRIIVQFRNAMVARGRQNIRAIGLSATPFGIDKLGFVRSVRQDLPPGYVGFNVWDGDKIDPLEPIHPPKMMTLAAYGASLGVPNLKYVDLSLYKQAEAYSNGRSIGRRGARRVHVPMATWAAFCKRTGYIVPANLTLEERDRHYVAVVENALREVFVAASRINSGIAASGNPVGICVRLHNNNALMENILDRLDLERSGLKVVTFFGSSDADSVKAVLAQELANWKKPFIIFVTNKARMGDAFPREVEHFMEFARKAGDMNALLQGLLGRACGVKKNSVVAMSEDNYDMAHEYLRTMGLFSSKASRHTMSFASHERTPHKGFSIISNPDHPIFDQFLDAVDREIVSKVTSLNAKGGMKVNRELLGRDNLSPLLEIARRFGILEYIEAHADEFFPNADAPPVFAKTLADRARSDRGAEIGFIGDPNGADDGWIFAGLRHSKGQGSRGDRAGYVRTARVDANEAHDSRTDRTRTEEHLEPQINVTLGPNGFSAFKVNMPLVAPVTTFKRSYEIVKHTHGLLHLESGCQTIAHTVRRGEV